MLRIVAFIVIMLTAPAYASNERQLEAHVTDTGFIVVNRVPAEVCEFVSTYRPHFQNLHKKNRPELRKLLRDLLDTFAKDFETVKNAHYQFAQLNKAPGSHEPAPTPVIDYNLSMPHVSNTPVFTAKSSSAVLEACLNQEFAGQKITDSNLRHLFHNLCARVFAKKMELATARITLGLGMPYYNYMEDPVSNYCPAEVTDTLDFLTRVQAFYSYSQHFARAFLISSSQYIMDLEQNKVALADQNKFNLDIEDMAWVNKVLSNQKLALHLSLSNLCIVLSTLRTTYDCFHSGWLEAYQAAKQPAIPTQPSESVKKKKKPANRSAALGTLRLIMPDWFDKELLKKLLILLSEHNFPSSRVQNLFDILQEAPREIMTSRHQAELDKAKAQTQSLDEKNKTLTSENRELRKENKKLTTKVDQQAKNCSNNNVSSKN